MSEDYRARWAKESEVRHNLEVAHEQQRLAYIVTTAAGIDYLVKAFEEYCEDQGVEVPGIEPSRQAYASSRKLLWKHAHKLAEADKAYEEVFGEEE